MGWTPEESVFDSRLRQRDFSVFLSVHTDSGAHPASHTMGSGGSFPGINRQGFEAGHTPPYSVEVKNCHHGVVLNQLSTGTNFYS
jgi:hypothetical protein